MLDSRYPWFNEKSDQFFQKDYALPRQTLHDRVVEIAHIAEARLKISGFADRFIGYMQAGFYSLSTPVWTNYGS